VGKQKISSDHEALMEELSDGVGRWSWNSLHLGSLIADWDWIWKVRDL